MVGTGLQRHIGCGACRVEPLAAGVAQGHDFSVWPTRMLCGACAYHFAAARNEHAANTRAGVGNKKRLGGEPKRLVREKGLFAGHSAEHSGVTLFNPTRSIKASIALKFSVCTSYPCMGQCVVAALVACLRCACFGGCCQGEGGGGRGPPNGFCVAFGGPAPTS